MTAPEYAAPALPAGPAPAAAAAGAAPAAVYSLTEQTAGAIPSRTDRRLARHQAGPAGIGGVLILPIIGLLVTLGWNAWNLYNDFLPLRQSEAWTALTTPGSPVYHRLWQPLALFEVFSVIVMVIAPIALLALIFRKRRSVRGYLVAFYVFSCLAILVDSAICLLVMVDWLRSIGLQDLADSVSSDSARSVSRAVVLAALWIPYFLRSQRVKNTFVHPEPETRVDPAGFRGGAHRDAKGRGHLRGALVVTGIVVFAGASVFAYNTYLGPAPNAVASSDPGVAVTLVQQADAAYAAGDLDQAIALYDQAIAADPGSEPAYYSEWAALLDKSEFAAAFDVATELTVRFPASRQAWFALGFSQETNGDLQSAAASYAKSLGLPQSPAVETPLDDAVVRERLDLVSYINAIARPRVAIAEAVNQVNAALDATTATPDSLSGTIAQVTALVTAQIGELEGIFPPAYFATFHEGMLSAYAGVRTACEALGAAASKNDSSSLGAAKESLDAAIDRFNRNDALGTTLMNNYYGQEPPIALTRPAAPGA